MFLWGKGKIKVEMMIIFRPVYVVFRGCIDENMQALKSNQVFCKFVYLYIYISVLQSLKN